MKLQYTADIRANAIYIMRYSNPELQQIHLRGDSLAWLAEAHNGRAALDRTFQLILTTFEQRSPIG